MDGARCRPGGHAINVLTNVNAQHGRTAHGHPRLSVFVVYQIVQMDAMDAAIEASSPDSAFCVKLQTCDGLVDEGTELTEAFQEFFAPTAATAGRRCRASANAIDIVLVAIVGRAATGGSGGRRRRTASYPPRQSSALPPGRGDQPPVGPADGHGDGPPAVVLPVQQLEHLLVAALRVVGALGLDQRQAEAQVAQVDAAAGTADDGQRPLGHVEAADPVVEGQTDRGRALALPPALDDGVAVGVDLGQARLQALEEAVVGRHVGIVVSVFGVVVVVVGVVIVTIVIAIAIIIGCRGRELTQRATFPRQQHAAHAIRPGIIIIGRHSNWCHSPPMLGYM
mmetsp:Transcript_15819/g.45577  ORF Transcript_15819/g.45577 Transcript_15819/m.45577 type:complete len:338 (+) Transcript_15819:1909-2922(+)